MRRKSTKFPPLSKIKPKYLALGSLLSLLAVVLIVKFALSISHNANEDFDKHAYEATVKISAVGFLPGTLNVKPMTRVYFENHDAQNHRLMPTVKEPDGRFVTVSPILPNSGWAFTFTKKGSYKFYDANNPTANGEIVVR